jgi:hypothetical protein
MSASVQYRLMAGKLTTRVEGPDDADIVITVDVQDLATDPAAAFMAGRLKAAGHTGRFFELLRSGEVATALAGFAAG